MGELIFITGASGFLGSATAVEALRQGYKLRICLRGPCKRLETLLSRYSTQVEFVFVPDFTNEAAFSGQLDGVDYILHLASPVPHGTESEYYFVASKITTVMLQEATRARGIKKVVVMSSLASLLPIGVLITDSIVKEHNHWNLTVDEAADFTVFEDPSTTAMNLYHASKLLANKATWEFWKNRRPHYSLVVLHPGFTFGHNPMQTNAEEIRSTSNEGFWQTIMSGTQAIGLNCVHIRDVVEAQIRA
ncbi:NAD-dependent epimerase/dehydratase [Penicillium verhagenii]|nr:NAD-dependent epimerase/dehydratase [Penicillium verhagenii]